MPVVPVKSPSEVTTRVDATATRSPLTDVASGLSSAGNATQKAAIDMQIRENADLVMQAEIGIRDAEREHRLEVESRKGTDAFGVTTESEKWWDERLAEQSGNLKNDAQRTLFGELMKNRRQVSLDTISGYEAAERRNSFNQSAAALIEGSINNAAESAYNPAAVALESERIRDAIADLSDSNGWTPEMRNSELEKHLTAMHGAVVNSLMADSPLAAQEYFKQNRKEISGTARAEMDALIKAKVIEHKAQGLAEKYFTDEASFSDAVKKVRKINDPKLQKATRAAVNALYSDEVAARRENEAEASNEAWKILTSGRPISSIPPNIWDTLAGTERAQLQSYEKARVQFNIKPPIVDNLDVLNRVQLGIEEGVYTTPQDLEQFRPFLRQGTFDKQLTSLKKETAGIPQKDILKAYENRTGASRTPVKGRVIWTEDDQETYLAFQEYVNKRAKEGATPKDLEDLADRWYMDGYGRNDRFLSNDPDTFGESIQAGRNDFVIRTPERDRRLMENTVALLQASGVDTTVDDFYTTVGFDARRYFAQEGVEATPEKVVAYSILRNAGKPVTLANIEFVVGQL